MGNTSDFHLPEEILRVMPTDPYEQLDIARKITSIAIASRVLKLESENSKLKQKISEKDQIIEDLQQNLSRALEDQSKLINEKNVLTSTVKKLNRDVAKLEAFKKTLLQSLNEDDGAAQSEAAERTATDQHESDTSVNVNLAYQSGSTTSEASSLTREETHSESDAARQAGKIFSLTPFLTPHRTPSETPTVISASGSPKRTGLTSSKGQSSTGSPTNGSHERKTSLLQTRHSNAPNSPPHTRPLSGKTPRVDGKEFFQQARTQLSYEQFSAFLATIKELNAHRQSKEETLRKADEIFGSEHKDLYLAFEGLLSRHLR
eukprot:TRINITY_DN15160_c0_g3_i1.p1 TRINITY_DN15160_c0_g3~~TRINITY_DN15160_c0_g3_i1.p1  ORF type:complete len:318 (+),score=67.20 TRINITY_DN15160_c0_g3_i1:223-1176(+)